MKRRSKQRPATAPRSGQTPVHSRRRFLGLMAAGSAALLTTPAAPGLAAGGKAAARPSDVRSAPVKAEIANQKKYLSRTLATIRDYELPPGSDLAFAFRPIPPRAAARRSKP